MEPNLFDGPAYDPETDNARLKTQIERVYWVMRDRGWRTLGQLSVQANAPHASVSAQLRHLRKERFGSHTVNRRKVNGQDGLYEYQLIPSETGLLDGQRTEPSKPVCTMCGGTGRALEPDLELRSIHAGDVHHD